MNKRIHCLSLPTLSLPALSLIAALIGSTASAESIVKGGFKNVVIGTGCASTCIDGKCEETCKGEGKGKFYSETLETKKVGLVDKEYKLTGFEDIVVDDSFVLIQRGSEFHVSASNVPNAIDYMQVSLELGADQKAVLKVSIDPQYASRFRGSVLIQLPTLASVRAYGNADVQIEGFNAQDVNLEASSNAGIVGLNNKFGALLLRADGNADIDLMKSEIVNADVTLNDQSNAKINFGMDETGVLTGSVTGMSDLEFCGNPRQSLKVSDMADATELDCG